MTGKAAGKTLDPAEEILELGRGMEYALSTASDVLRGRQATAQLRELMGAITETPEIAQAVADALRARRLSRTSARAGASR